MKNNYKNTGFIHIEDFFSDQEFETLIGLSKSIVRENDFLDFEIKDLEKLHLTNSSKFNEFSARGYKSEKLYKYINSVLKQRIDKIIKEIYKDNFFIEDDATLLAWYPENLIKGFTGYHQDGPSDEIPHGFPHCWIPLTDERKENFECIPKTHTFGNFPHSHMGHFIKVESNIVEQFKENKKSFFVKPKDLFIFNTRLMHCLTINNTNSIAWSIEFIVK
ncbi:phytanoyl-CoA dioxygenase family protein [Pseudoalteromonas sp. BZB3]|uniref:phytanoyl-CoA dioxygenase family protein n=1 Tax=Pseudoalteromonas sp. BZB3 TaxID=3136670 RepID=UPI0032C3E60C